MQWPHGDSSEQGRKKFCLQAMASDATVHSIVIFLRLLGLQPEDCSILFWRHVYTFNLWFFCMAGCTLLPPQFPFNSWAFLVLFISICHFFIFSPPNVLSLLPLGVHSGETFMKYGIVTPLLWHLCPLPVLAVDIAPWEQFTFLQDKRTFYYSWAICFLHTHWDNVSPQFGAVRSYQRICLVI